MANKKSNSKLRFAALCRVSTEKQEKKGESLHVQKDKIIEAVNELRGTIVEWYGGQEHATPGHEKKEINRMLADAQKGKFNAFICSHADRWSRDNKASQKGLDILFDNGIRFFVLTTEHDLRNPTARMFLEFIASIGKYQASTQQNKSMDSRISKARKGKPTSGRLLYGRTYNKKTNVWGVDDKIKADVEVMAKRYLAGEGFGALAEDYKISHSYIHRILTQRCGDTLNQVFHKNGEVIVIPTKIPRLLPQTTIDAIHKKAEANKTYTHGEIKNRYLLSRMIFCNKCNSALSGTTIDKKYRYRYYRHKKDDSCKPKRCQVKADVIEDMVLRYLFSMFGNPVAIQRAIERAAPDRIKLQQDQGRLEQIAKELKTISKGRERILDLVGRDKITEQQADKQLDKLNKKEVRLEDEKSRLLKSTANRPNAQQIKTVAEQAHKRFELLKKKLRAAKRYYAHNFDAMTYEEKRGLCEMVFGGKSSDGKRLGVHVEWIDAKSWKFSIHGHLINLADLQPMSQERAEAFGEPICGNIRLQEKFLTKYTAC